MESRAVYLREEWVRFDCEEIPTGQFVVTQFVQNLDGTKIYLDDENIKVEIFFDGLPLLVRQSMEGVRMRTWSEIQYKYNDKNFFRDHFFFEVKNSLLTEWAVEEGCGFYEKEKIKHFCIITIEEVIDILAEFEPCIIVSKVEI